MIRCDADGNEEALSLTNQSASSSVSPTEKCLIRKRFLQSIKNSMNDVRTLAAWDKLDDPQAQDELGRTAMIIAIDNGNYDMIKCLLDLEHDMGDALFHAVGIRNADAVRIICENLPESTKMDVINSYPTGHYYPVVVTPLLLAGKINDFDIIKILLQHGAKMPCLNDLVNRAHGDSYLKFLAVVHWYEAASSEAFILLTSDDPLDTIFSLGDSLQEVEESLNVPLFNLECERIQDRLADLSIKLLSLARDNDEIGVLLRGGHKKSPMSTVPLRIHQALAIDSFKKFVCHPSSQDYMSEQWEISKPRFLIKYPKLIHTYLFNIMIVLLYPILCVGYILLPRKKMQFMQRPEIRFLVHVGSRVTLVCILILSTQSTVVDDVLVTIDYNKNITSQQLIDLYVLSLVRPFTPEIVLILVWILGMTVRAIIQLCTQGRKYFFMNWWNVLDLLQLILYWIFVIMGLVSIYQWIKISEAEGTLEKEAEIDLTLQGWTVNLSSTDGLARTLTPNDDLTNKTQLTWQDFQAQLIAEAAFAIANVLSFLQILHHLVNFSLLGPLLISFHGMIYDVFKFFIIFGFLLVSFSIGMTQLYRKFEVLEVKACQTDMEQCPETPFLNFGQSMETLFWSMFDLVDRANLKIDSNLDFTESIGTILYASFMLIGSIVMLNALIAMMSNTYTRVEENCEEEWKVARTNIMVEYITESAILPPPFNLVPTVKSVIWLFRYLGQKCHQHCNPATEQRRHKDQDEHKDETYKEVSRTLGERCLRAIDMERMQFNSSSDIKALKKSVEKFSCDMSVIQQQLNCIMNILNQKTEEGKMTDTLTDDTTR